MNIDNISTPPNSTPAEPQVAPSNRAEQLDRLHYLQQLVDVLLDAAKEVSWLAQQVADENEAQGEAYDAAQSLIAEVDAIYLTAAFIRHFELHPAWGVTR